MQLYTWSVPPAVQDSGNLGPEELFIQPLLPTCATAIVDYILSYLILQRAMSPPNAPPADGTTMDS